MSQSLLFSGKSFATVAETINNKVRRTIELLQQSDFEGTEAAALAASLYEANQLSVIIILTEDIYQADPEEIKVQVPDESAPNGIGLVDGTRFSFSIPFSGNAELLQVIPTAATGAKPFGTVKEPVIFFQLQQADDAPIETLVQDYETNLGQILSFVAALNFDIIAFNEDFQASIITMVNDRAAKLAKKYQDAEAFGVPILLTAV